jgi:glyoxylase-like metal-dependent hydrolase (beta-lactamase superfamily II)
MKIERWTGPPVDTHAYLLYDEGSGEAWAVDAPLDTAAPVLERVREAGLRLTRVILTHGHFDHILDVGRYRDAGIPVAAHPLERPVFEYPQTALFGLPYEMPSVEIAEALSEGAHLRLGEVEWTVWHVPGHSPGHLLLYSPAQNTLLGGDLLFQGGYGRIDLPGSDPGDMTASLLRLLDLPGETRVYPGHGSDTTLGAERGWLEPMLSRPGGVRF